MYKNNDKIENPENYRHLLYIKFNRKQIVNIIWISAVPNSFPS